MIPRVAVLVLLGCALLLPADTHPETAFAVFALLTLLLMATIRRTAADGLGGVALLGIALAAAGLASPDRLAAGERMALMLAVAVTVWVVSRRPHTEVDRWGAVLFAGVLAVWAVVQGVIGLESLRPEAEHLQGALRLGTLARIESGRAFASHLFPGHLAAVLATALALSLGMPAGGRNRLVRIALPMVLGFGIVATRSPIGIALGAAVVGVLAAHRARVAGRLVIVAAGLLLLVGVVLTRPDALEFEPLIHRVDNWRAALWLWSQNPVSGVGLGGFGTAVQGIPLELANRPAHAHSQPLEWMAELGLFGLIATAVFFLWLGRLSATLWVRDRSLAVAVLILPVHSLVDFSLLTWGGAIPWAVVMGWACASPRPVTMPIRSQAPVPAMALVLVGVIATPLAALNWWSTAVERQILATDPAQVPAEHLLRAVSLAPWRTPALESTPAFAEVASRLQPGQADEWIERSQWLRPGSAGRTHARALIELGAGRPVSALGNLWLAQRRQPENPERVTVYSGLAGRLAPTPGASEPPS